MHVLTTNLSTQADMAIPKARRYKLRYSYQEHDDVLFTVKVYADPLYGSVVCPGCQVNFMDAKSAQCHSHQCQKPPYELALPWIQHLEMMSLASIGSQGYQYAPTGSIKLRFKFPSRKTVFHVEIWETAGGFTCPGCKKRYRKDHITTHALFCDKPPLSLTRPEREVVLAIAEQGRTTIASEVSNQSTPSPSQAPPGSQQVTPRPSQTLPVSSNSRRYMNSTPRLFFYEKRAAPYPRLASSFQPRSSVTLIPSSPHSRETSVGPPSPRASPLPNPPPWTSAVSYLTPTTGYDGEPRKDEMQTSPSREPVFSPTVSPSRTPKLPPPVQSRGSPDPRSDPGQDLPLNSSTSPNAVPQQNSIVPRLDPRDLRKCLYALGQECVSCWLSATGTSATHPLSACPEKKATGHDLQFTNFKDEIHYPHGVYCFSCGLQQDWRFDIPQRVQRVSFHPKYHLGHTFCPFRDTLTPLAYLVWSSPDFRKRLTRVPGTANLDFETIDLASYIDWLTGKITDEHTNIAPPMLVILDTFLAFRGKPKAYDNFRRRE